MRKTSRVYGEVFQLVRCVAARRQRFTRLDLDLTRHQFSNAVTRLICRGELRRVAAGRRGRFGWKPAVFEKV